MAGSASKESNRAAETHFGEVEPPAQLGEGTSRPRLGPSSVIDGKYRLLRLLGEGGMGTVWCAYHLQLELEVAIKLLRAGPNQATLSERLKLEAQAAARLVHPAIVRVFDIDTSEHGEPYIVMELLTGESLSDLLDRGRLSGVSAVQLLLPIAEALALAHSKGIVHRDLKPHNIFLTDEGERLQPKLLDFGIAKLTNLALPSGSLTETGVSVGSPDYMSPEQARGSKDVDYRADIWSFAVVLYEAVTLATPFTGDNYNAQMRAIVEDEPAPIPLDESVDQELADLILWGLAKDREQRPGSIQELGRELARWLLDRGVREDVCGTSLGSKWITRVSQKSVPVIQLDAPAPAAAPKPEPVERGETLVSAREPYVGERRAPTVARVVPSVPPRRSWRVLASFIGAFVTVAVAVWALGGARSLDDRALSASAPSASLRPVPAVEAPRAPSAAPLEIVTAAATPVTIASVPPAPSSSPQPVHSAPTESSQNKARQGRSQTETSKPSSATKPGRDGHDATHELLQAY